LNASYVEIETSVIWRISHEGGTTTVYISVPILDRQA
jgi:hypothetical protein